MDKLTMPVVDPICLARLTTPLLAAIDLGEKVINRTGRLFFKEEIEMLALAVAGARKRLVEGGNPIGRETTMFLEALQAIDESRFNRMREIEAGWIAVATALLPLVRAALYDAMLLEDRRPSV